MFAFIEDRWAYMQNASETLLDYLQGYIKKELLGRREIVLISQFNPTKNVCIAAAIMDSRRSVMSSNMKKYRSQKVTWM